MEKVAVELRVRAIAVQKQQAGIARITKTFDFHRSICTLRARRAQGK
jgi:hypothetical protein